MKYEYTLPVGTDLIGGQHPYKIVEVLGQGGFGFTYLASTAILIGTTSHKVFFAIKEYFVKGLCYRNRNNPMMLYSPASHLEVEEGLNEFKKNDAKRLAEVCLGNENIVHVNEVFEANGTAYYVMEYLQGQNLRELVLKRIKSGKSLKEEEALAIIRPIAQAVDYIHSQYHLLHLDIKPDNIMMRQRDGQPDQPVLIDFGISVHFNKKGELTTTHKAIGCSKGYSPIEQYLGMTEIIDNRKRLKEEGYTNISVFPSETDVYALAATLYFLLVGKDPYDAQSITPMIIDRQRYENSLGLV